MRTIFIVALLACTLLVASGFSLLREFDDERLLPHVNRVRRAVSSEESAEVKGSGHEKVEGSGERVARDVELKETSGEEPKTEEKKRTRREDELIVASGQEEGSGEVEQKPHIRLRRSAEADEDVKGSGQEVEGSGQA